VNAAIRLNPFAQVEEHGGMLGCAAFERLDGYLASFRQLFTQFDHNVSPDLDTILSVYASDVLCKSNL